MIRYSNDLDHLIVHAGRKREARDIEILLLSRSIPFTVQSDLFGRRFYIPNGQADAAKHEIACFMEENSDWPQSRDDGARRYFRLSPGYILVVVCLVLFFWQVQVPSRNADWASLGMVSADKVLSGQWHRVITALTLHADVEHLLSNVFGLLVFVGGVHQLVGFGVSWLLVLVAGGLGNLLTVLFYQTGHNALGASTAVFGALGITGALGIRKYLMKDAVSRRIVIPMAGAFGLYALFGTNPTTDVMAHFFGLLGGLIVGLISIPALSHGLFEKSWVQFIAFICFWGIIGYSWMSRLSPASF